MATPAAAVLLDILVNTGSFETDTERARKALERFQKTAKQADPAVRDFSKGLKDAANSAAFLTGPLGGVSSRLNLIANAATAGKLAFFAWGAAAFASYEILKKTLTVGEEYEKNQLRTNAILKATGGTAGLTATEIHDLAVSLGESTLASVGGAEKAAQKLLTFRSVAGETFKEALRLSQDLSATGFGQLEQVVVQVGKALEDPIKGLTALKRVGVSFTETQKEMIENFLKTNDLVSAQGIILEALRTQVGGAGAAEGAGLAGAFDLLNQRVEEFFEIIGKAGVVKFFTDTLNILSGAINSVNKTVEDSPQARLRDLINLYGQLETEGAAPEQLAAINNEIQKLQVVLGTLGQAQDNARQKAEDYQNSLKTERIEEYIKSQRVLKKSIEEVADAAKIQALKDLGGNAQQIAELQQVLNQNRFDKAQLDAAREARAEAKRAAKEAIRDAERLVEKRQAIVDKLREEVATFGQTAAQRRLYELELLKAPESLKKEAESYSAILDQLKEMAERREYLNKLSEPRLSVEQQTREITEQVRLSVDLGDLSPERAKVIFQKIQEDIDDFQKQQEQNRQQQIDAASAGLLTEEELLVQSYDRRRELILEATELTEQQRQELLLRLQKQTNDQQLALEQERIGFLFSAGEDLFGGLSQLAKNYAGEQSTAYRALFAIEKAFAIARAGIQLASAIGAALQTKGIIGIAEVGAIVAAFANVFSAISSATFSGGRALGGPVAGGKSYMVGELGPELFTPATNGAIVPNNVFSPPRAPEVNIRQINAFDPAVLDDYLGSDPGERMVLNIIQRNPTVVQQVTRV